MKENRLGNPLKSKRIYAAIYKNIAYEIRTGAHEDLRIEHVGGTSLKTPSGKGDVDIYVVYNNKKHMRALQKVITQLYGKPAKIHTERIRFNLYRDGVEVEIQVASAEETNIAVALRDYLKSNSSEAEAYTEGITKLRQAFLKKMFTFKKRFAQKASR
jgi:GrpB-like predicted nucleotidyltransferase (UPF0157 family)